MGGLQGQAPNRRAHHRASECTKDDQPKRIAQARQRRIEVNDSAEEEGACQGRDRGSGCLPDGSKVRNGTQECN
jgi:hypothetical protein